MNISKRTIGAVVLAAVAAAGYGGDAVVLPDEEVVGAGVIAQGALFFGVFVVLEMKAFCVAYLKKYPPVCHRMCVVYRVKCPCLCDVSLFDSRVMLVV